MKYKKGFNSPYQLERLKSCLLTSAFDVDGSYAVHADCSMAQFGVHANFMAALHKRAVSRAGDNTVERSKLQVIQLHEQGRVVVPDTDSSKTQLQYLASIGDKDQVLVVLPQYGGSHGLSRKPSNNTAFKLEALYKRFILANRSSTGRTKDKHGRAHGALYHLDCKFRAVKEQTGAGRFNPPDENILSEVFTEHAQSHSPDLGSVAGDTQRLWLKTDFGINSEDGHTVLCPHKSDYCPKCYQFEVDEESLTMSLKFHVKQGDQSEVRKTIIQRIKQEISDRADSRRAHNVMLEAAEAQSDYKDRVANAHQIHSGLVLTWKEFLLSLLVAAPTEHATLLVVGFCATCCSYFFSLSSDYQEDKLIPAWHGRYPQPGPTYFFSKITAYLHLLCADSCGEASGSTKFGRNSVYIRPETIGGPKNSNDTLSTIFDFLLSSEQPTSDQPTLFRTGYTCDGPTETAVRQPAVGNATDAQRGDTCG